jgi:hypothetical protein
MISNAMFAVQQDAGAKLGLARGASPDSNSQALLKFDKSFDADSLNNQTTAKAAEMMEQSQKKAQDEDIKRSFSTFA